jgi:hypothetical protein
MPMLNYDANLMMDDDELGQFAIDLMGYSDSASEIFSKIDDKMNLLNAYFNGSPYNELINIYRSVRKNYPIVKNTIHSYSDDLITLRSKVHAGDHVIALQLEHASDIISKEAKKMEL